MSNIKTLPKRDEINSKDKWNLKLLFENDEAWESSYKKIESEIQIFSKYKGNAGESIDSFIEIITKDLEISREFDKLYAYAHLKSDEDKTNQNYTGIYQKALSLYTKISGITSFIIPEIQAIPDDVIKTYLEDKRLEGLRFYIDKIIRYKPHTLSTDIEEILAKTGEISNAPNQFFSMLDNADLSFGTIERDGETVELSHGNFITFLMHPDRALRKKAFFQYYKTYENHQQSISTALAYSVKKDCFYSDVRKYCSCRESSLFPDNIPDAVYDNLIDTVKKKLDPLFKYFDFRKKILGLSELHFYDTYVPIVKNINFNTNYEEAADICIKALSCLGQEYTDILKAGLEKTWVDRYENKGKRSGAYSSGCYDSPPYILMNFENSNINSLYTLIHEAGHSMHTYYSNKNQPYAYHQYTIFVAEVASTFNEALLSNYLMKYYENDPRMKAYILNREIDNIRATLFRQTMFAEFEKVIHEMSEKNISLTLDSITGEYYRLLKIYFGDSVIIDDALKLECLRIPHFYSSFYVYKYATGISASIALADRVIKNVKGAVENYTDFLKLGGSMFPLDELKLAGVDMTKPEAIEDAVNYFAGLVDTLMTVFEDIK
ncbi:MAG: oligoendopeptidase F [Spirochaetes bacterium]|nr:oligoendopeptidase F [Spirochaetota bacterium]